MSAIPPSLRAVTVREWISALERDGFACARSSGSHRIYRHSDGRMVPVTFHHLDDTFRRKTLRAMLASTQWTTADLQRLGLLP
jgi:predicted RNA binding protein YcfA (HicA-like mRNA interferase family)